MKRFFRSAAVLAAAAFTVSATGNWNTHIVKADRAIEVGNPEAETLLTEFVSYTCGHCATFTIQGEAPLQLLFVGSGKLRLEVRSVIRNVVDLTATMMVQCGNNDKFLQNHTMFMTQQKVWLEKARNSTRAQQAVWMGPERLKAHQNMAQALGFYDMMETRGYSRPELDRCLSDSALEEKLLANTSADFAEFGHTGTPSFAINGQLAKNVHSWQALQVALNEQM